MDLKSRDGNLLIKFLLAALIVTWALYCLGTTVADTDLWGYLAFGRVFWETRRFPYHDIFSYVPTLHPWIYHEWLSGVIFYPIYQTVGATGLQLLKYALGLATLGLVYLTARKRGAGQLAAVLGVLIISKLFRLGYSPVRAQVFTYAFFAFTFYLIEGTRLGGHWSGLWYLLPIQLLWCNLHGGFLAGLGLILMYALGETLSWRLFWPYWTIFVLATLVTLINPYGLKYWAFMVHATTMQRPEISEWASVSQSIREGAARVPLLYFFLLNIFALLWWLRFREITAGLALALTSYLGWKHLRHQVFFLILLGGYLPGLLAFYLEDLKSRPRLIDFWYRLRWEIPVTVGLVLIMLNSYNFLKNSPLTLKLPPAPVQEADSPTYYPLGAVAYLQTQRLSDKMLVNFDWGEYLIWNLYPQCHVALDGRFETVYPMALAKEYFDFIYGTPNWRKFLINYPPDLILVDSRTKISDLLLTEPEWQRVYVDGGCALFRRKE